MSLVGPLCVLASLVGAVVVTRLARQLAVRKRLFDHPNERSAHTLPRPRLGGIGIVLPFIGAGTVVVFALDIPKTFLVVLGATMAIAVVGLIDDIRHLSARVRIVAQVICAAAVLGARGGDFTTGFGMLESIAPSWVLAPVAILWIVWFTNLYNFMDGIDGLAGGQAVLAMAAIAGAANLVGSTATVWLAAALAASASGFLMFNFPPAKIFMGDVGSTAIGFFLASVPFLPERTPVQVEVVALAAALFLLDASMTLVRRLLKGERVFEAHRTHHYQRPLAFGVSHRGITLTAYAAMLPLAAAALVYPLATTPVRLAFGAAAVGLFAVLAATVRRIETMGSRGVVGSNAARAR